MADETSTYHQTTFSSSDLSPPSSFYTTTGSIDASSTSVTTIGASSTVDYTTIAGIPPPRPPSITLDDILGQYWEYHASRDLGLYGYPLIIVLGTLGNLLTVAVMVRPKMRQRTTCFYMTTVAVFDTLVLYFACLRQWLSLLHEADPLTMSHAACKTLNFCSYTCFDIASWLLVLMTVDRFLVVQFPFQASKISSIPKARRVVIVLVIVMVLFNGHFFWSVELDDREFCNYLDDFQHFHDNIWPWLDAAVYSFVPFCLLLIFNVLIIIIHRRSVIVRRTTLNKSRTTKSPRQREHLRLSAMLLTVTFSFLLLSAPNVILTCIRGKYFDFSVRIDDFRDVALYGFLATVTNICLYLNHAVNFLLYCITGQLFRRELRRIVTCDQSEGQVSRSLAYSASSPRITRISESSMPASPALSHKTIESHI